MTTTFEAIYEGGKIVLPKPLPLPDKAHVIVTIQTEMPDSDRERAAWLKLSEESLTKAWDNPDDDIFNELLSK
ncbi:MAG TPA: antitoxin family protein [Verrucomicrobiae bacterium]|nr:antitoxin family protein [Verrucomicrobiae bacterium]